MQTILGAGGVLGTETARELKNLKKEIRLVSRNPRQVNGDDELLSANLLDPAETERAVSGSEVVYLMAGLPYKASVWKTEWPILMQNTIQAVKKTGARLVFLDNVYMYGKVLGPMTELTIHQPVSKKGRVRADIADMLTGALNRNEIQGLIARSADFYGPGAVNTAVLPMVFEKLKAGKKATWIGNPFRHHSFTYTPDAGKAVAFLGNDESAFNQIWHLPTSNETMNGDQFIKIAARKLGQPANYSRMSKNMLRMAAPFLPLAAESLEMFYQYEYDYQFNSSKFSNKYFEATTYEQGIGETIDSLSLND